MSATLHHAGVEITPLPDGRLELALVDRETGRRVTRLLTRGDVATLAAAVSVRGVDDSGRKNARADLLAAMTMRADKPIFAFPQPIVFVD